MPPVGVEPPANSAEKPQKSPKVGQGVAQAAVDSDAERLRQRIAEHLPHLSYAELQAVARILGINDGGGVGSDRYLRGGK